MFTITLMENIRDEDDRRKIQTLKDSHLKIEQSLS